jgi:hypothetical protein
MQYITTLLLYNHKFTTLDLQTYNITMCVHMHVCVCVCVSLQSALCCREVFYVFKSDFTARLSYLMWKRGPCSHGSTVCGTVLFPRVRSGL